MKALRRKVSCRRIRLHPNHRAAGLREVHRLLLLLLLLLLLPLGISRDPCLLRLLRIVLSVKRRGSRVRLHPNHRAVVLLLPRPPGLLRLLLLLAACMLLR
mmetsp:Transcript_24854/g.57474  ORF Transcript_24854/g.57474 Transcript_24854/m.57474 type:complete len:101 (+) Transcript_24854:1287-1589(+)